MKKMLMLTTLTLVMIFVLSFFTFALADYGVEENLERYPNWIGTDAQGLPTTMPIFSYATSGNGVINEAVWVEVPCDTDRDGVRDRVSVFIRRPDAPGFLAPSVMEFSPYHHGTVGYSRMSAYINSEDEHLKAMAETFRYHDNYPLVAAINPDTTNLTYDDIKYKGSEAWDPIWQTIGTFTPISWYTDPVPAPTTPSATVEQGATPPSYTAISRHQHYFDRGYAMLYGQLLGSQTCTGITSTLHVEEWLSAAAVVRWLSGEAQAFTTRFGDVAVKCTWSNGNVAMDGTSYPGTTPLVTAMTGVPGIKAIMTEANVNSWYDYYRKSGAVNSPGGYGGEDMNLHSSYNFSRFNSDVSGNNNPPLAEGPNFNLGAQKAYVATQQHMMQVQDRATGDYNSEWDVRNLMRGFGKIKSDVGILQTSGLMDWNVKPKHAFGMLQAMRDKFQGTHKYVGGLTTHNSQSGRLVPGTDGVERGMLKWYLMFMDHFLLGLDNKVDELMYDINIPDNITGVYSGYDYDTATEERGTIVPGTTYQKIYLTPAADGKAGRLSYITPTEKVEHFADMDIHAQLEATPAQGNSALTGTTLTTIPTSTDGNKRVSSAQATYCEERFIGVNRTTTTLNNLPLLDYIDKPINGRLMYISEPLTERLLVSGTVSVHLNAAPDKGMGNISVALLEIGRKARTDSGRTSLSAATTGTTTVFPAKGNVAVASATRYSNPVGSNQCNYKWVTWGHADVQNPSYDGKVWYDVPEQNYIPNFYFQTTKIVPGQYYNYAVEMDPYNYVFDVGTRIAIMVYGTDPNYSPLLTPECTAAFDVKLGSGSFVKIPLLLAEPETVTIEAGSIDDTQNGNVARGKEGKVPYSISDNSLGFSSLELELSFDGDILTPVDVTPSALLGNATFRSGVVGKVLKVSIASDKNIAGDGELFTVTYKVGEEAPYGLSNTLGVDVVSAKFDSFMDKVIDVEVETVPGVLVTAFAPITSIRIDAPAAMTVERGKTYDFGTILNANTTAAFLEWSVNNKAYATVNNTGIVTILNKTGTAVLNVKDPLGGMSYSIILRIV